MRTGPAGGPLRVVEGCGLVTVDAAADALAGKCSSEGYDVHEEEGGLRRTGGCGRRGRARRRASTSPRARPRASACSAARRARRSIRVAAPVATFDLAPDGAVAYASAGAPARSPGRRPPTRRSIASRCPAPPRDVDRRRRADRGAPRGRRGAADARARPRGEHRSATSSSPPRPPTSTSSAATSSWARQPCSRQAIVVWELAGAAAAGRAAATARCRASRPGRSGCAPTAASPCRSSARRRAPAGCAGVGALSILAAPRATARCACASASDARVRPAARGETTSVPPAPRPGATSGATSVRHASRSRSSCCGQQGNGAEDRWRLRT